MSSDLWWVVQSLFYIEREDTKRKKRDTFMEIPKSGDLASISKDNYVIYKLDLV